MTADTLLQGCVAALGLLSGAIVIMWKIEQKHATKLAARNEQLDIELKACMRLREKALNILASAQGFSKLCGVKDCPLKTGNEGGAS